MACCGTHLFLSIVAVIRTSSFLFRCSARIGFVVDVGGLFVTGAAYSRAGGEVIGKDRGKEIG